MNGIQSIIMNKVTQSQKNTHGIHSLINGCYPKAQNKQHTIHRSQEAQEGGMKWGCFGSSEKGNKILTGAIKEKKYGTESEVKTSQ